MQWKIDPQSVVMVAIFCIGLAVGYGVMSTKIEALTQEFRTEKQQWQMHRNEMIDRMARLEVLVYNGGREIY